MRILPRVNEDVNEEWISDKTRHVVDGLRSQRLDTPYIREGGRLRPASWGEAFASIADKVKVTKPDRIGAIAGDLCAVEDMFALKDLMTRLGFEEFDCARTAPRCIRNTAARPTSSIRPLPDDSSRGREGHEGRLDADVHGIGDEATFISHPGGPTRQRHRIRMVRPRQLQVHAHGSDHLEGHSDLSGMAAPAPTPQLHLRSPSRMRGTCRALEADRKKQSSGGIGGRLPGRLVEYGRPEKRGTRQSALRQDRFR